MNIGVEMLDNVPGRVSTEVDAHLSYDTQATIEKALRVRMKARMHENAFLRCSNTAICLQIVDLYGHRGVDPKRLYIKVREWDENMSSKPLG